MTSHNVQRLARPCPARSSAGAGRTLAPPFCAPVRTALYSLVALCVLCLSAAAQQADEDTLIHARCLTPFYQEYMQHRAEKERPSTILGTKLFATRPDNLPSSIVSAQGHFKVHYTTTGVDKPSLVDNDHNGVPDYIDSVAFYFEYAWHIEIDNYGYDAPPSEPIDGPQFDIYVSDLDPRYYGGAVPEPDNPAGSGRVLGYIILDNDYSEPTYSTHNIEAVKVTSAHEFHHIIQFASYRYDLSQASIYEATAVWFERQVHPEIPDYRQYVDTFLIVPQQYPFSTNTTSDGITGYAHVLFMDYAAKRTETKDVVREMWEQFRTKDEFPAIDAALRLHGLSLQNAYCELAKWCYFTGTRTKDSAYFLEAPYYPTMRPADPPRTLSSSDLFFQGTYYPLVFGLYQVTLPRQNSSLKDTADFVLTDATSDIAAGGTLRGDNFSIEVSKTAKPDYTPLISGNDTILYYRLTVSSSSFCLDVFMNGSIFNAQAVRISPQPFINDGIDPLLFGLNVPEDQAKNIRLRIFSSSFTPVADIVQTGLQQAYNQIGVIWDGRDRRGDLAKSGVYFYEMQVDDGPSVLGKFAIVERVH